MTLLAVDYVGLGIALVVVLGVCLAGFAVATRLRHSARSRDAGGGGIGFTLADLRRMHAEGQIDDAAFERAKAKMVATTSGAAQREAEQQRDADERAGVAADPARRMPEAKDMDLLENK